MKTFDVEIPLDRAYDSEVMAWLNENIKGDWNVVDGENWMTLYDPAEEDPIMMRYPSPTPSAVVEFDNASEALMFKLKYGGARDD